MKSSFVEKYPELLNLGKEEASVYAILDKKGGLPAKVISDVCQIPYSRIHQVLYRLQQQELIISRGEAPKIFSVRNKDPELQKRMMDGGKTTEEKK